MEKKVKKSLLIAFGAVVFIILVFYMIFFLYYMIKVSGNDSSQSKAERTYHIIVGGNRNYTGLLGEFYDEIKSQAPFYDAESELLYPSSLADSRDIEDWIAYAKYVCADGLILFCSESEYSGESIINVHDKAIPVVVTGPEAIDDSYMMKKLARIVRDNPNWKKGLLLIEDSYNEKEYSGFLEVLDSLMDCSVFIYPSDEKQEDSLKKMLKECIGEKSTDVIFCIRPDETNLLAQLSIELNVAGQIDIVGLLGDSKNTEYINKGIVNTTIPVDERLMADKALKELFDMIGGVK